MRFAQFHNPLFEPMKSYAAAAGKWQFLIIDDNGAYTASYRLRDPAGEVSASSTIMGPFGSVREAELACEAKWRELRSLA